MKIIPTLKISSMVALCVLSTNVLADQPTLLGVQGGDIALGKTIPANQFDLISYYKTGKSGQVVFTCFLGGSGVVADLFGGKNFSTDTIWLRTGANGPFTWTLQDSGFNEGNIRLRIYKGTNVTVTCKEVAK